MRSKTGIFESRWIRCPYSNKKTRTTGYEEQKYAICGVYRIFTVRYHHPGILKDQNGVMLRPKDGEIFCRFPDPAACLLMGF